MNEDKKLKSIGKNSFTRENSEGGSKNLSGLTTGTLATAASLASLKKILNPNEDFDFVKVIAPFEEINVKIEKSELIAENMAKSSAIKYPYNDPDVTVDLAIVSSVELIKNENNKTRVVIEGADGVGTVTKPGLQIAPGNAAINPVPLAMIKENIERFLPEDRLAKVSISVPNGDKIAKKTMNPKLGIVGGISILGTTGIARSMSNKAYRESLLCHLDIAMAMVEEGVFNSSDIVFVPGNIGEKLALKNLNIKKDQIVQMGNYVGFMLEEAQKRGINKFTIFGHVGKLIKIAGGIFNTKHSIADGRREIMASHAALCDAEKKVILAIFKSKTTEEMLAILKENSIDKEVLDSISLAIKNICFERFNIDVDIILVDMQGNQLNSSFNQK